MKNVKCKIDPETGRPSFATEEEAFDWMDETVDDPYQDNERISYDDDPDGIDRYVRQQRSGCCGEADYEVLIAGRKAMIGCNYGH